MSLTTLVVQRANQLPGKMLNFSPSPMAAEASKVYVASADFEFVNDGQTLLIIDNQQAAATTAVAITVPNIGKEGVTYTPSGVGDTVPAVRKAIFGPFPTSLNNASNKIVGTINPITTCFMSAISLGK
jgi:hypothetical protein